MPDMVSSSDEDWKPSRQRHSDSDSDDTLDEEGFVDAETDLEGMFRVVVAEEVLAMETRMKRWMTEWVEV